MRLDLFECRLCRLQVSGRIGRQNSRAPDGLHLCSPEVDLGLQTLRRRLVPVAVRSVVVPVLQPGVHVARRVDVLADEVPGLLLACAFLVERGQVARLQHVGFVAERHPAPRAQQVEVVERPQTVQLAEIGLPRLVAQKSALAGDLLDGVVDLVDVHVEVAPVRQAGVRDREVVAHGFEVRGCLAGRGDGLGGERSAAQLAHDHDGLHLLLQAVVEADHEAFALLFGVPVVVDRILVDGPQLQGVAGSHEQAGEGQYDVSNGFHGRFV